MAGQVFGTTSLGKEPYLTKEQQEQFSKYVDEHFNLRSIDCAAYIEKIFKVK